VKIARARVNDIVMLLIAGLLLVADQITKHLVIAYFSQPAAPKAIVWVPHIFELTLVHNSGAAFGIFRDDNILFIFIGVAVVAIAVLYIRFRNSRSLLLKVCFGLILGGAIGNLLDRIRQGYVTDFLYFHIGHVFSWPVFNVADSGITVGVVLLVIYFWIATPSRSAGQTQQQRLTTAQEPQRQASVERNGRQ